MGKRRFGRPPKSEKLVHQLRIFMHPDVVSWVQDEASKRRAAGLPAGSSVQDPAPPAPVLRDIIERADWQKPPAYVRHDRRPSLTTYVSESLWQQLNARLDEHLDFQDLSTLVYAYAVLPAALAAGISVPTASTPELTIIR